MRSWPAKTSVGGCGACAGGCGCFRYKRLMTELNVSKPTLIAWNRKFQFEIRNLRAIELETLSQDWQG
jgi:hypothetical protein